MKGVGAVSSAKQADINKFFSARPKSSVSSSAQPEKEQPSAAQGATDTAGAPLPSSPEGSNQDVRTHKRLRRTVQDSPDKPSASTRLRASAPQPASPPSPTLASSAALEPSSPSKLARGQSGEPAPPLLTPATQGPEAAGPTAASEEGPTAAAPAEPATAVPPATTASDHEAAALTAAGAAARSPERGGRSSSKAGGPGPAAKAGGKGKPSAASSAGAGKGRSKAKAGAAGAPASPGPGLASPGPASLSVSTAEAEGVEGGDGISDSESTSLVDSSEDPIEEEEEEGWDKTVRTLKARDDSSARKKKGGSKKAAGKKGSAASNVEGVGLGALDAALRACDVDVAAVMTSLGCVAGQPVPYTVLADTFEEIAVTSKRLSILTRLTTCFRVLLLATPEDLLPAIYMCVNRVAPSHQGVELGMGESTLIKDGGVGLADRLERSAQAVKAAYSECPSYDEVVPALLSYGPWELSQHCHFKPSVPVKPMLAKPTTGVGEVLEKFKDQEFTCEYKYDGERAQVHIMEGGAKIMIFSRNSENMTAKYPDIVARLPGLLLPGVDSLVLDGEAVGWDPLAAKILPFQILSTRARKDVALADIKVQVVLYAFDCLYVNGRSLLQAPLTERRAALYASVKEKPSELQFALTKTSRDLEELELFLTEAVEAATEGLIVKTLDDTYEPARRSSHWLKLKKDYMEGVGDTFDVVPIGAFYGKGKRTGLYGAYLLAVYDPDNERYQTISKLGTGFSEEQLQELADSLRPHLIPEPRKYYQWGEAQQPDVWFEPVKVWEVKAADLSISPVHKAAHGLVDAGKGISIRFPRLIRIRDDKGPEDATSAEQVADMYRNQAVVMAAKRGKAVADGDGDD